MGLSSASRTYRSPLRQEQAATTRQRICAVAARLFEAHGYGQTSIALIAREAGVSAQTVYDAFTNKRGLARAVLDRVTSGDDVPRILATLPSVGDPLAVVQITAQVTRRILERGASAVNAMRRADDQELVAEWRSWEQRRYQGQQLVIDALSALGALRPDRAAAEHLDVLWALSGRDLYDLLVVERGWSADRYEQWLTEALAHELLARA